MTDQDQIKALAELDGWQRCTWYDGYNTDGNGNTTWRKAYVRTGEEIKYADEFPNYLASYDAIIPLIQKQPTEIKMCIFSTICAENWIAFNFTPTQLCEALLRATGKWIE